MAQSLHAPAGGFGGADDLDDLRMDGVFAGQGVGLDKMKIGLFLESRSEQVRQVSVDLNGQDLGSGLHQLLGEGAGSGADFDDHVSRLDLGRLGDQPDQVLVDHEILPETLARLGVGLLQEQLDFFFCLSHLVRQYTRP